MAVTADLPRPRSGVAGSRTGDRSAERSTVPFLARPLTSYHLVMWSSGLLVALGLVMVLSASSVRSFAVHGSSFAVFDKQALWLIVGLPLMAVAARLPAKAWRMLAYPMLVISALGLFVVLVPGIGTRVSGATRWIDVGPAQLQPSEPAKLALALWGADLLVRKQKLLRDWKHLVIPLLPVTALFVMLVMAEPDLGTTVTMVLVVMSLLFVVGAPMRMFGFVAGVIVVLIGLLAVVEPYRLQRLTSFAHPFKHSQGGGYQAVQGLYALASGGWWGEGLGASRAKWGSLPNAHTDYIFAIIGEELGLVGTLAVVALFVVLGYAGFRIAARTRDPFVRLASAAVTTWLVGQALINMGYVVGLLPVTGIPLPLISFGGTSLVLTLFAVGMLASFARSEPGVAQALAARGPSRFARATAGLAFWRNHVPARPAGRPRPVKRPAARSARSAPARPARGTPARRGRGQRRPASR